MGLKNKLIGMELERLTWIGTVERFAGNTQVSIRYGDASKEPPEGTIYYLFNPFRGEQMVSFEQLVPKTARIVYYNPTEIAVFKDWTAKEIWATHPRAVLLSK